MRHTLADVVRAPIELSVIEDPQIRQLTGRCLDRDTKNRLARIGEARIAIDNDLAAIFPTSEAVNHALRAVAEAAKSAVIAKRRRKQA